MKFEKYFQSFSDSSEFNSQLAEKWFLEYGKDPEEIDIFATEIASQYVLKKLDYSIASCVMNRLMVELSWQAPKIFWTIYVAFENLEVLSDPGEKGITIVSNVLESIIKKP